MGDFYIGPMSKNVVDAILEFNIETDNPVGFIPSRRQVEYDGGYVNGWTTKEFAEYVDGRAFIQRDHGGPHQGNSKDDGLSSFSVDCEYFDAVHIDPWKAFPDYESGFRQTVFFINYLYARNKNLLFEVGTEESIRQFSSSELDRLLFDLQIALDSNVFENIRYAVVQSGVGLDLGKGVNTGNFNPDRLSDMIGVCKKYGVSSKEHNGDYLSCEENRIRFDLGLDSINIAPEFGQLETSCYLDEMSGDIEQFYQICYNSKRWEKWVSKDFNPEDNKEELIRICGHYVLSDEDFLKNKPNIDYKIVNAIKTKLVNICG